MNDSVTIDNRSSTVATEKPLIIDIDDAPSFKGRVIDTRSTDDAVTVLQGIAHRFTDAYGVGDACCRTDEPLTVETPNGSLTGRLADAHFDEHSDDIVLRIEITSSEDSAVIAGGGTQ
jgi:hypothetical protein